LRQNGAVDANGQNRFGVFIMTDGKRAESAATVLGAKHAIVKSGIRSGCGINFPGRKTSILPFCEAFFNHFWDEYHVQ
jgi:hypothetical protein